MREKETVAVPAEEPERTGKRMPAEARDASRASCECVPECCGWTSDKGRGDEYTEESEDWIKGRTETASGPVPLVKTTLNRRDMWGRLKVRLGIGRMSYKLRPGLYGVGDPGPGSPVLVSANYKLSFDALRRKLDGLDAWILVLDTKGINVWCAAAKGTFGTEELVHRVEETGLTRIVSNRTLILPQLGAPGVAAHEVSKRIHFKVVYGPVRAADIKGFLTAGMKATPEMRRVRFGLRERLVLTAIELVMPLKYFIVAAAVLWGLSILGLHWLSWKTVYPYLGAILIGGFLVPVFLPWIPGRAFAWKGWMMGIVWAVVVNIRQGLMPLTPQSWLLAGVHFLLLPAISAFLAMGFTGSSTYTSLSGVLKEMRYAVPAILGLATLGIVFLAIHLIGTL